MRRIFQGNRDERQFAFVLREDIEVFGSCDGRTVQIETSDYRPDPPESWDVDEWESRRITLEAPTSRAWWSALYRLARALARRGAVTAQLPDGRQMQLACDGSRVSFNGAGG